MVSIKNIWESVKNSAGKYSSEFVAALGASNYLNDVSTTYRDNVGVPVHQAIDAVANIPSYFGLGPSCNVKEVHGLVGPVLLTAGALLIANSKRKLNNINKRLETFDTIDEIVGEITHKEIADISNEADFEQLLNNKVTGRAGLRGKKLHSIVESYIQGKLDERLETYNENKEATRYMKAAEQQINTLSLEKNQMTKRLDDVVNHVNILHAVDSYLKVHGIELLTEDPVETRCIKEYILMKLLTVEGSKNFEEDALVNLINDKFNEKSAEYKEIAKYTVPANRANIESLKNAGKTETVAETGPEKLTGESVLPSDKLDEQETKPPAETTKGNGGSGSWGLSAGGLAKSSYATNDDIKKYVGANEKLSHELDDAFSKIDAEVERIKSMQVPYVESHKKATPYQKPEISDAEKIWVLRGRVVDGVNNSNKKSAQVPIAKETRDNSQGIYEHMKAARVNRLNLNMLFEKKKSKICALRKD